MVRTLDAFATSTANNIWQNRVRVILESGGKTIIEKPVIVYYSWRWRNTWTIRKSVFPSYEFRRDVSYVPRENGRGHVLFYSRTSFKDNSRKHPWSIFLPTRLESLTIRTRPPRESYDRMRANIQILHDRGRFRDFERTLHDRCTRRHRDSGAGSRSFSPSTLFLLTRIECHACLLRPVSHSI